MKLPFCWLSKLNCEWVSFIFISCTKIEPQFGFFKRMSLLPVWLFLACWILHCTCSLELEKNLNCWPLPFLLSSCLWFKTFVKGVKIKFHPNLNYEEFTGLLSWGQRKNAGAIRQELFFLLNKNINVQNVKLKLKYCTVNIFVSIGFYSFYYL